MRPITAAASARVKRVNPPMAPNWKPTTGASRMAATADSRPAITHTISDTRLTRTPRSRARSLFSAVARAASP